jgi:hypothetical protein
MLIAIYGMFATGKTTFVQKHMDEWTTLALPNNAGLTCVIADTADSYHYEPTDNEWLVCHDVPRWKGKQEAKLVDIPSMIRDRDMMWVLDSARYFGGMHQLLVDTFTQVGGGLKMIIPVASEAVGKQFLIDRCNIKHKTFRADYWTEDRLRYECRLRYTNPVSKYYETAGIPSKVVQIDYERAAWDKMERLVKRWLTAPESGWYEA